MGYRELAESLRKEGDKKIRSLQAEAQKESEKIKQAASEKIRLLRESHRKRLGKKVRETREDILKKANDRAYSARLRSENTLSERLFSTSVSILKELRDPKYGYSLESFVNDLPEARWESITVNPEDSGIAKKLFPDAEIVTDNSIAGGIGASCSNGKIIVLNTLEKRLEKSWPGILPEMIKDIYKHAGPASD